MFKRSFTFFLQRVPVTIEKCNRRSLLSVVNHTQTPSGFRLLRSNLLQPLADKEAINARFDAVEELLTDMHLIQHLREIFRNVHEMENVLALCVQSNEKEEDLQKCENNITQLLNLKQTLEVVLPLRRSLAAAKCSILKTIYEKLSDERVDEMMKILDDTPDLQAATKENSLLIRNQRCYAVREGISVNLDVSRKTYEEMLRDLQISGTAEEIWEYLPEQNVHLGYSVSRGFHHSWAIREAMTIPLPPIFINIVRNRSSLTFSSKRLVRYNDRIEQCAAEVMLSSNVVVHHLIQQLRDLVPVLYNIMDATANIDFLTSLALYSSITESVRPVMGEALLFNRGRHPLLDCHLGDRCVPNDTYLTTDSNFAIITGPNMAGKSTYLRQVCQLSVLAQLGCMVPAEVAVAPELTRLFARFGHNDSMANGSDNQQPASQSGGKRGSPKGPRRRSEERWVELWRRFVSMTDYGFKFTVLLALILCGLSTSHAIWSSDDAEKKARERYVKLLSEISINSARLAAIEKFLEFFVDQMVAYKKQIVQLSEKNEIQLEELTDCHVKTAALKVELKQIREEHRQKAESLSNEAEASKKELEEHVSEMRVAMEEKNERIHRLEKEKEELESELAQSRELSGIHEHLRVEVEEARKQKQETEVKLLVAEKTIQELQEAVAKTEVRPNGESEVEELITLDSAPVLESSNDKVQEISSRLNEVERKNSELEQRLATLTAEKDALTEQLSTISSREGDLSAKHQEELSAMRDTWETLETEKSQLATRLDALRAETSLAQLEHLRVEVEEARKEELKFAKSS